MIEHLAFCDQSDEFRQTVRSIVEKHGGTVAGYDGAAIQVTMPAAVGARCLLRAELANAGMTPEAGAAYYFAACNGEPESQLHWKRPEDRGNRCAALVLNDRFIIA